MAGRYRIDAVVGKGGMGVVYRAHDQDLDDVIALKTLGKVDDPKARERFKREVSLARKVTHPNVCRVFDLGESEEGLFLTMELVEGVSLRAKRDELLPEDQILRIVETVAHGLAAAHDVGVVHRDLKPANVMLADDGRILLTDFGIARGIQDGDRTHVQGRMIGTPYYMAPEQVLDETVGPPADVYSLGVMFYELVTGGVNPFGTGDQMASALRRIHMDPPPPTEYAPDLRPDVVELIMRMIARDPSARPNAMTVAARAGYLLQGPTDTAERPVRRALPPNHQSLAVLSFRYRGDESAAFLGEGISEELIDVLSKTRGLKVLTHAVTQGLEAPDVVALGADGVVTGTVQCHAGRVRVKVRMADPQGRQIWSSAFESPLRDFFDLQERLASRIAEALRLELEVHGVSDRVPAEAVKAYLQAREMMRRQRFQADEAADLLDHAVMLAPQCPNFLSTHALAHGRSAAFSGQMDAPEARRLMAKKSLERALSLAPDMPDTQLALALSLEGQGDALGEIRALHRALELAPTCAAAHARLGELMLFAGRRSHARAAFELALEHDPYEGTSERRLARMAAYDGDPAGAMQHIERALEITGRDDATLMMEWARVVLCIGERDRLDAISAAWADDPAHELGRVVTRVMLGTLPVAWLADVYDAMQPWFQTQWFHSHAALVLAEAAFSQGAHELGIGFVAKVEDILFDLDWLQRCPIVPPAVRQDPRMVAITRLVQQRVEGLWIRTPADRLSQVG